MNDRPQLVAVPVSDAIPGAREGGLTDTHPFPGGLPLRWPPAGPGGRG